MAIRRPLQIGRGWRARHDVCDVRRRQRLLGRHRGGVLRLLRGDQRASPWYAFGVDLVALTLLRLFGLALSVRQLTGGGPPLAGFTGAVYILTLSGLLAVLTE